MSAGFLLTGAVMVAAALACVLAPMLRSARRNGRPRAPFFLALALVLVVPPAAFALYAWIGTPQALSPQPSQQLDLADATAQLRAKLQQSPDDANGWLLLGQAYSAMQRAADARDAFGHALKLEANNPDVMVAYAEADAEANPGHMIGNAARALLQRAVALQPDHQRALWLLGISDYQLGHFDDATANWKHLVALLPAGSKLAAAVAMQVVMAQARAQGKSQPEAEAIAQATASAPVSAASAGKPAAVGSAALVVRVELDPKLAGKVAPGDTLFVYARAIDGPPMPLAVARLSAAQLPASVTLTDAMAMSPQLKLSMFPRVQVVARISKSGKAMPQAGDLEAPPVQVATDTRKPVALTIDRVD